jgi:hypothetical protein
MPEMNIGQTIVTTENGLEVTVKPDSPLSVGRHVFQLVVEDDSGNQSQPDQVTVIVRDSQAPTAVIGAPAQVEFGQSFKLDGRQSSDIPPGKVVRYHWTLVE